METLCFFRPVLRSADTPRALLPSLRAELVWVVEKEDVCAAAKAGARKVGGIVEAQDRGALKTPLSSVLHVQCMVVASLSASTCEDV